MSQAVPRRQIPIEAFFAASFVLLLGIAAFGFPYAALQDFPEWVYQSYLFNRLAAGNPSALFEIKNYPVPYTLAQLILSSCVAFVSPMTASRIMLALYAVATLIGIRSVIARHRLQPLIGWPVFISIVALNAPFWNGYMAYQIGLIVLLSYLSLPAGGRTNPKLVLLFSLLSFFSHGCTFFAFTVFVGIYALFARRVMRCGLAMLPSLALLVWYLANNGQPAKVNVIGGVEQANIFFYKIYTLLKAAPYHNPIILDFNAAAHFGQAYFASGLALDLVFVLAIVALAGFAIQKAGWRALIGKPEIVIGVLLLALTLALPRTAAGIVNPGERVVYPALIALALGLFGDMKLPTAPQAALAASVVGGIVLFAIGLVAGSRAYRNEADTPGVAKVEINAASSKEFWFGHRLVQFDAKMRYTQRAWAVQATPTLPLAFDTGLLAPKTPAGAAHD